MIERRQGSRNLGQPLAGYPEWVIPAQPDEVSVNEDERYFQELNGIVNRLQGLLIYPIGGPNATDWLAIHNTMIELNVESVRVTLLAAAPALLKAVVAELPLARASVNGAPLPKFVRISGDLVYRDDIEAILRAALARLSRAEPKEDFKVSPCLWMCRWLSSRPSGLTQ